MNARTTSLLIVLALTLAACVAPMPAPPVKAPTVPEIEQPILIPSTQTEQRQNLPAVTDPWAYPEYVEKAFQEHQQKFKDEEAARLLVAQKALTDKLMTGLPMQIRDYIETYAMIKVAEMATAPESSMTTYPDILRGVLEGSMTTTPYMLPEQKTTNPKQPAVQELDDMLKPVTLPEDLTATKIAMLEHVAIGAPAEVQQAIANYIEDLKLPVSTMPVRDQWYLEQQAPTTAPVIGANLENAFEKWYLEEMNFVQSEKNFVLPEQMTTNPKQPAVQELDNMLKPVPEDLTAAKIANLESVKLTAPTEVQQAIDRYIEELTMPASTMPVRDQWYLEDQTPSPSMEPWYYFDNTEPAPALEPYWENFFKEIQHGR